MHVSSIVHYPVKSCQGVEIGKAEVDRYGIRGDRLFVLVGADGQAITQRTLPRLNLISADLSHDTLRLTVPGMETLAVDLTQCGKEEPIRVVGAACGEYLPDAAEAWFKDFLGRPCRLFRSHIPYEREQHPLVSHLILPVQQRYPDCSPILITGEASLTDLNRRTSSPVAMSCFRPNLVVGCAPPYDEDNWRLITVGDVALEFVGLCERCGITLILPGTEERGQEPLLTLRTYRKVEGLPNSGMVFGAYYKPLGSGTLSAGDPIRILERTE